MKTKKIMYKYKKIPIRVLFGSPHVQHWKLSSKTTPEQTWWSGTRFDREWNNRVPVLSEMLIWVEEQIDKGECLEGEFVNVFHPEFHKYYELYEAFIGRDIIVEAEQ